MSRFDEGMAQVVALGRLIRVGEVAGLVVDGCSGFGKTTFIRDSSAALDDVRAVHFSCTPQAMTTDDPVIAEMLSRLPHQVPSLNLDAEVSADAIVQRLDQLAPCLVTVDDLHLIDDRSVEVLLGVVGRARGGVLFICAVRSCSTAMASQFDSVVRSVLALRHSTHVQLKAMQPADITALLHLRGIPQRGWIEAIPGICAYTGGAPALIRELVDEFSAPGSEPVVRLRPTQTLSRALHEGLNSASEDVRRLAEALAVLDTTCTLATAAAVGEVKDATAALEYLLARGLARWSPLDVTTPIGLRYPIYRDAIYAALSPSRRHELHRAAASHSSDMQVWLHRVASTSHPDPELARGLATAARDELTDARRAAQLLHWAAEISDVPAVREAHLLDAALRLVQARQFDDLERLRPQLDALGPSRRRSLVLGMSARAKGDLGTAERLLKSALYAQSTEAGSGKDDLVVRVSLALAAVYALQDRPTAQQHVTHHISQLPGLTRTARDWILYFLADAVGRQRGDASAALLHLDRFDPSARELVATQSPSQVLLSARGMWRVQAGQFSRGINELSEALGRDAVAARTLSAVACLAWAHYAVGSWDAALTTIDASAGTAAGHLESWQDIPLLALQVSIEASRGNFAIAREQLDRARAYGEGIQARACRIHLAISAATLAQAQGDYPGMIRAINEIPDREQPMGEAGYHEIWWRPLEVEALIRTDQPRAAAASLARLTTLAESIDCLRVPAFWLAGCLAEAAGDLADAERQFEQAVAQPVEPDTLWLYRGRAEQSYGQVLITRRERRAAVKWLREAGERYLLLGAAPYLDRVAAVLSASGLDGRSGMTNPADDNQLVVLSDRERKVAHLVGSGLTNKEASRELFLSPKTVEYHLGNIFTKLGISSRNELRSIVRTAAASAARTTAAANAS